MVDRYPEDLIETWEVIEDYEYIRGEGFAEYRSRLYLGKRSVTAIATCTCGCSGRLAVVSVRFPDPETHGLGLGVECPVFGNRQSTGAVRESC
jgi:hypothetical protein